MMLWADWHQQMKMLFADAEEWYAFLREYDHRSAFERGIAPLEAFQDYEDTRAVRDTTGEDRGRNRQES